VFLVSEERFEQLVDEALESLPEKFVSAIENVAITVDGDSRPGPLLGLYHGIPLTKRDSLSYSGVMPDEITLYKNTICSLCRSDDDVRQQVRITVLHEIGHYFGISDGRLEELGWG
jgi:predicted Zn-dependent protease with MMP-like domain